MNVPHTRTTEVIAATPSAAPTIVVWTIRRRARPASPKVPIFDGTVSAQFRPWIIQFEAIARHQCWTLGERVVRLVASLTGPAANLLIGMTLRQLEDYAFLVARLSRRYDPPEREEAHRAELRARTRRRNETADEFAENLKNLAQRACTNADQNMLDNLVVERFREGHGNVELKKTFMLVPLNRTSGPHWRVRTHWNARGTGSTRPQIKRGIVHRPGKQFSWVKLGGGHTRHTQIGLRTGWTDNWVETEVSTMAVPAVIRMGEILNRARSSIRTETVSRAHRIQSGDQHPLEKWSVGHAARRAIMRRTAKLMARNSLMLLKLLGWTICRMHQTMKMIMQKESRTIAWETTRSLCSDPCYSAQGFSSSSCPFIFIITPENS